VPASLCPRVGKFEEHGGSRTIKHAGTHTHLEIHGADGGKVVDEHMPQAAYPVPAPARRREGVEREGMRGVRWVRPTLPRYCRSTESGPARAQQKGAGSIKASRSCLCLCITFAANDPLRHVKGDDDIDPEDEVDHHIHHYNRRPETVLPELQEDARAVRLLPAQSSL
jgi:hypothetical protein